MSVAFDKPRLELSEESKNAVIDHFEKDPVEGVTADFSTELAQGVPEVLGVGELIGVIIAAIVLLVMLGSVIAAALPLVTAILASPSPRSAPSPSPAWCRWPPSPPCSA